MTTLLASPLGWFVRAALCLAFVYSGIAKLTDWPGALAEQAHFGLEPAAFFAAATVLVQLGGSALVLFARGRAAALGAVALAVFTLAATLVAHAFWRETGIDRFRDLNAFLEHIGLIGGFVLVAALAWRERVHT
jgi:uncharacterized membrane protein YphA (DoxX/SURF4 family)